MASILDKAGTNVGNAYKLISASPLDVRFVVADTTERDSIVTANGCYPGLEVWVESEKKKYIAKYDGTTYTWEEIATIADMPDMSPYMPKAGGRFTGPISFQASSLPSKSLSYITGIDLFASGGEMGWQSKADFLSGYATQQWVGDNHYTKTEINTTLEDYATEEWVNNTLGTYATEEWVTENHAKRSEGIFYVEGTSTTAGTWTGANDRITEYYDGLTILYKINKAGASTTTLNINGLGAKKVYRYSDTKLTTHYIVNTIVMLTYTADLNSGCWMVISDYDANSNTVPSIYCDAKQDVAAKTGSCTAYTATANTYSHILIRYANTVAGALTLNVNSQGAKPIYINGSASSATNYTLPAGTYIIFYDGTNYYFQTDGTIPNHYTKTQIDTTLGDYVKGPASSTANAIARYNGTGGKTIKNTGVTIDDSNNMIVPGDLSIYAASGSTPKLTFLRGTATDSYNDWAVYGNGGSLWFDNCGSAGSWNNRVQFLQDGGIVLFNNGQLKKYTTGGSSTGYTYTLPNATGTIALTSDIPTIPSDNVTGTGTSGSLAKFSGEHTITDGPAFSATKTNRFLGEDGVWELPKFLQTRHGLNSSNWYGDNYPLHAYWRTSNICKLTVTNYKTEVDMVDGCTVETALTSDATDKIPTSKAVADYVGAITNQAVIFKGTLGTNGDITELPAAAEAIVGDAYKVITAGTYQSIACKPGDMLICYTTDNTNYKWAHIPGDTNTDTLVQQSNTTTDNWRKVLLSAQYNSAAGTATTAQAGQAYVTPNIEVQASTGKLRAGGFIHTGITTDADKTLLTADGGSTTLDTIAGNYVTLDGTQTITGAKTFKDQPITLESTAAAGTILNGLVFKSSTRTGAPIKLIPYDVNGSGVILGDGGAMFIGSGESPTALYNALTSVYGGTENTYISSDGPIYLVPNCNTIANRKTITINTSGNIAAPGGFTHDGLTAAEGKTKDDYVLLAGGGHRAISEFTDTTYEADRGISLVSGKFGHSNTAITAQSTKGLYKFSYDAYGHITGTEAFTLPTVNNATLTMNTSGTGISGSQTFTANQSTAATFTVTLDSSAAGNRGANKVVLSKAAGQIDSDKFTVTSAGVTKSTIQYNTTEGCLEFVFA